MQGRSDLVKKCCLICKIAGFQREFLSIWKKIKTYISDDIANCN